MIAFGHIPLGKRAVFGTLNHFIEESHVRPVEAFARGGDDIWVGLKTIVNFLGIADDTVDVPDVQSRPGNRVSPEEDFTGAGFVSRGSVGPDGETQTI